MYIFVQERPKVDGAEFKMRLRQPSSMFPNLDLNPASGADRFKTSNSEGSRGRVDPIAREKMEQVSTFSRSSFLSRLLTSSAVPSSLLLHDWS